MTCIFAADLGLTGLGDFATSTPPCFWVTTKFPGGAGRHLARDQAMDTQVLKKATAGKVGRASRTLGQLWQVPTFVLGLLAFLLVAATAPLRQDTAVRDFENDLDQLRLALGNKQEKIENSVSLAESLLDRLRPNSRKAGQVYFLAGSVYQRLAEETPASQAEDIRKKALATLKKARTLGVTEEDTPPLLYRMGVLLYETGTDLERALDLIA